MIGKIKGNLVEVNEQTGLIDTTYGVFYEVYLPYTLLLAARPPQPIEVYTYHQVREDAQILFGFETKREYDVFKLLIGVPGVGPKTAYTTVSRTNIDEMIEAIKENNLDYFSKIPGLGKKTALKIILELSQKFKTEFRMDIMNVSEDDKTVVDALVSLGFKSSEAKNILARVPKELSMEEKIKEGIRIGTNPKSGSRSSSG